MHLRKAYSQGAWKANLPQSDFRFTAFYEIRPWQVFRS
jgi:hypothetical protein